VPENPDGTNGNGSDTPVPTQPDLQEIEEEEVPLADAETVVELPPEPEEVELPDEEVPLSSVPRTGDDLPLWCAAALLALAGLGVRKRRRAYAKCKH
jgi:hypothetical protein